MKTSDEIWRDFNVDENCVTLLGEDKTRVYLSQVRRALFSLGENLRNQPSVTENERSAVAGYLCQRSGRIVRWLSPPLYFCLGNLAMLAGLLKFCFSRDRFGWERAR